MARHVPEGRWTCELRFSPNRAKLFKKLSSSTDRVREQRKGELEHAQGSTPLDCLVWIHRIEGVVREKKTLLR